MNFHPTKQAKCFKAVALFLMPFLIISPALARRAKAPPRRYEPTWESLKRYEVPE
jgi:hypothetical protein